MFDRIFVINLNRRQDRWEQFRRMLPSNWPFSDPERWTAVDGTAVNIPSWYRCTRGSWGCLQSHLGIWREQIKKKWQSVLVLEDDVVFTRDAVAVMLRTMEMVSDDWDQIYFGGQHLDTNEHPPEVVVQDSLIRCRYVNRTHAYAIRLPFARVAKKAISGPSKRPPIKQQVDYRLGELHMQERYHIYAPWRFCCGQARGYSDVCYSRPGSLRGKHVVEQFWNRFPIV